MHHSVKCPNCDDYRLTADKRRHRWSCDQCGYWEEARDLFPSHQAVAARPRTRAARNRAARLETISLSANRVYDTLGSSSSAEDIAKFFELADLFDRLSS